MAYLSKIFASLSLVTALTLAACGGGDQPPRPLNDHFDDMYIAAIPMDQKQSIVDTQQGYSVGKMENAKSEADFNELTTQLQIAHNDSKSAHIAVDSANSTAKDAQASADTNRINDATKKKHAAEVAARAADERVHYLEAYRGYLHFAGEAAAANMYWHEAQFELAKATLAQKNNIAPKGFVFEHFATQESARNRDAQARREKAEAQKHHALDARDTWLHAQEEAERETGNRGQYPDPLAPAASSSVPQ